MAFWAVSVREATSTGHIEGAEEAVSLVSGCVLPLPLQALLPPVTKTDLTNEKSSLSSENLVTDCHSRDPCLALLALFRAGGDLTNGERHRWDAATGCSCSFLVRLTCQLLSLKDSRGKE